MPAKTGKQYRLAAAVAHDPRMAKKTGMPMDVAREMVEKTPAKKRKAFMKGKKKK